MVSAGARSMVAVASTGYLLTAWAWALLGPLAPMLHDSLGLTPVEQALVVALPVMVGALGRIPVGALSDRFGGRVMFLVVVAATVIALLELATVGHRSQAGLLVGAVLLGVAGTAFAVAVPFVSAWFPGGHRGLALGLLGVGLVGSAFGGLSAVRLVDGSGAAAPFVVCAAVIVGWALVAALALRDAPHPRRDPRERGVGFRRDAPERATGERVGIVAGLRLPITRRAVGWYAVSFAVFVTFSSYLPVYLDNAYGTAPARGGDVMAAFVLVAVLLRPLGGWLADRFGPRRPLAVALAALAAATAVQAAGPPSAVLAVTLPVLAVGLGVASTAVLAQVGAVTPVHLVGRVTGVVTALAGVAGFLAPVLMAVSFERLGGYGVALGVMAVGAAGAALSVTVRSESTAPRPA